MKNLDLYEQVRSVPREAQRKIQAGRLKGKTDINPMWRIKTLTEQFGVCGFGWYTEIVRQWLEPGANGESSANVEIRLFVKMGGEWSAGILGIGGSMFVSNEKTGRYTDDDAYKKAYTDAISVACKALGIAADVYYENDRSSKYTSDDDGLDRALATEFEYNGEIHRLEDCSVEWLRGALTSKKFETIRPQINKVIRYREQARPKTSEK